MNGMKCVYERWMTFAWFESGYRPCGYLFGTWNGFLMSLDGMGWYGTFLASARRSRSRNLRCKCSTSFRSRIGYDVEEF